MNIEILREFVGLSEDLNFTQTAQRFYITQSVLSKHIASLEKEVGVELFIRNRQRVRLTNAGRAFSEDMRSLIKDYDSALQKLSRARNSKDEVLRVAYLQGATKSFMGLVYSRFIEESPHAELRLTVIDGALLGGALDDESADIIVGMQFGRTNDQWYDWSVIYGDYYGCIVAKNDSLASLSSLTAADLTGKTVYIPNRERFGNEYSFLHHKLSSANGDCLIYDGINSVEDFNIIPSSMPNCVLMAPSHLRSLLWNPEVKFIPMGDPVVKVNVSAIWRRANDNPLIPSFVKALNEIRDEMGVDQLRGHF